MAMGSKSLRCGGVALWAVLGLGSVLLLFAPARAAADIEFCEPGEGAGQCGVAEFSNGVRGLAIDYETGHLYVADRPNNRVEVFTEDGKFIMAFGWGVATGANELQTCGPLVPELEPDPALCRKGIDGAGAGQFENPTKVAVDNIASSGSHHDVYVVDEGGAGDRRIEKFSPSGAFIWEKGGEGEGEGQFKRRISVGVGPGGILYVLDNLPVAELKFKHRLQRLEPSGALIPPQCVLFEGGLAIDLGVETDGSFWVVNELNAQNQGRAVRKYSAPPPPAGCTLLSERDAGVESNALALDEAGRIFVQQSEVREKAASHPLQTIMARDANGEPIRRFGYDRLFPLKAEGLAVHSGGEGGIFLAFGEGSEGAAEGSEGTAGISRLEYAPDPVLPPPGPIAAPSTLEVPPAEVGSTKATVVGEVNPEGKATQVHFEYVAQADYEADVGGGGNGFEGPGVQSSPTVALGASEFHLKSIKAQIGCPDPANEAVQPGNDCLTPGTEYRWRIVATNSDGAGEGTVEGPAFQTREAPELDATYSTEVGTDTARLNAEVNPLSIPTSGYFEYVDDATYQADLNANGAGHGFDHAIKVPDVEAGQKEPDFGAGESPATRSISIYPLKAGTTYHYRLIATNTLLKLTEGTVSGEEKELRTFEPPAPPPCANDASRIGSGALLPNCRAYELVSPLDKEGGDIRVLQDGFALLAVLEQSSESGEELAYGSARSFGGALAAPFTSQYIAKRAAGSEWETHPIDPPRGRPFTEAPAQFHSEFKAFSGDLCDAWITTYAEMPGAPPGYEPKVQNLLRRHDRLCGPEGFEALAPLPAEGFSVGEGFTVELLGTSADGSHAIFSSTDKLNEDGTEKTTQLYESVNGAPPGFVCFLPSGAPFGGNCTAGTTVASGNLRPLQGAISADGSRIFWSAGGAAARPLYVRIDGTHTVAVSEAAEGAEGTSGSEFWGAAADGSSAVFTTGDSVTGQAALYSFDVDQEASTKIAEGVFGVLGIGKDSKRIYFASKKDLAAGASEGEPNLYLYEAGGGTTFIATLSSADLLQAVSDERYGKRTARVTPDGAHALFASVAPLDSEYDNKGAQGGQATQEIYRYDANAKTLLCVSCNPSGARPAGPSSIPFLASPLHAARMLSDDGSRVYFESADRLVARDSNGRVDVYQWEEAGTPGCGEGDSDFSAAAQGCVELISSGQGPQDSRFVESDPSGRNVFFATVSSLLPQDYGLFDIYDARERGGLPIPPPKVPPCEGDSCHHTPPPPQMPTPASSDYKAPPAHRGKPHCAKGQRKVRRKGKARCVPKHKKQHHKQRAGR